MSLQIWHKFLDNRLYFGASLAIAGVALGYFLSGFWSVNSTPSCVSNFKFINPSLDCDLSNKKRSSLDKLQNRLEILISGYKNSGKAGRVSVFTRDLSTSRFMSIGDSEIYYMASLLKLPVAIGGFKLAEVEPAILDQEIKYTATSSPDSGLFIKPAEELEPGKEYTARELMKRALKYSDNNAAQSLYNYYPRYFMDRILQALGLQMKPSGENYETPVTARIYANIFRVLYNASYLTRPYSNEALSILTDSEYRNGAVAKLPPSVPVAHKFAERTVIDPSTRAVILRQLHECGIVYAKHSSEPYSFCIMTEGQNFGELERIQQDISLEIYNSMIKDD